MREATARASPSATGAGESREGSEPAVWRQPDMSTNENQQFDRFDSIDDAIDDLEAIRDRLDRDANGACAADYHRMDDRRDELGDVIADLRAIERGGKR